LKRRNMVSLVVIVVIGIAIWGYVTKMNLHEKVASEDVQKVILWGEDVGNRSADEEEKAKILSWFNEVKDVRENKNLAGNTATAGIVIQLEDGEDIRVLRSGDEFEIQRKGKAYWAREPHLDALLDELGGVER
jgi:hypothetical protein